LQGDGNAGSEHFIRFFSTKGGPSEPVDPRAMGEDIFCFSRCGVIGEHEKASRKHLERAGRFAHSIFYGAYERADELFLIFLFEQYLARFYKVKGVHDDDVVSGFKSAIQAGGGFEKNIDISRLGLPSPRDADSRK
jgi:hypothetical protein